jgi:hypothetical protein
MLNFLVLEDAGFVCHLTHLSPGRSMTGSPGRYWPTLPIVAGM